MIVIIKLLKEVICVCLIFWAQLFTFLFTFSFIILLFYFITFIVVFGLSLICVIFFFGRVLQLIFFYFTCRGAGFQGINISYRLLRTYSRIQICIYRSYDRIRHFFIPKTLKNSDLTWIYLYLFMLFYLIYKKTHKKV